MIPFEQVRLSAPYPRDNHLNMFGDFNQLCCKLTGEPSADGSIKTVLEEWTLEGVRVTPLTQEQAEACLRVLYFNSATRS